MRRPLAEVRHQAFLTVGFRAQLEHLLLPHQFDRQSAGNHIGQVLGDLVLDVSGIVAKYDGMASLVKLHQFATDALAHGTFAIVEVIDVTFEEGFFSEGLDVEQLDDSEGRTAYGEDVQPPIPVAFDYLNDFRRAADAHNTLGQREEETEFGLFFQASADHLPVPWLEDVQGKIGARQEHNVQREKRDAVGPRRSHSS